ncbi:OsmC family protein [Amphritea japonica]|uniref:OsmC family protein n=1 Tax=Amphritea japonica ATCC BAA-1530 TaxID=1278309 RepID=A0A7R6SRD5_9GAMM|nr:OsmC family protein [Amphritea japonica]BBB25030.1 OsmC family protein [Amphritea japonica ATCC BAA-1530]
MAANKVISVSTSMNAGAQVHADIRGHKVTIDQPKQAGGTDEGPTPLEYFLFSLAGCIASIARIAATQQKIEMRSINVDVDGAMNPAGLLGKPTEDRVGFQTITVKAQIDADLSDEEKATFLEEVCHRCPLDDNIMLETKVTHSLV